MLRQTRRGFLGSAAAGIAAASGLAGSMQVGFSAASTFVAGLLLQIYVTTPVPLVVVIVVFCLLAVFSPRMGRRMA